MNMRLVSSVQKLRVTIVGICKHRDHAAQYVFPEEEYRRNTSPVEVFHYLFVVLYQPLLPIIDNKISQHYFNVIKRKGKISSVYKSYTRMKQINT